MAKPFWLMMVMLTALLAVANSQNQTESVGLVLDTPLEGSATPPNYAFYNVALPDTIPNGSVLLVTVDSHNKASDPVIFVSQSIQFPTYENADQVCYFQSLDSCSLTDLTASSTIYVAVYFYEQTNFTVVTELVQSQPIKLGLSYEVNFTSTSAGLVTFTIDEQYD